VFEATEHMRNRMRKENCRTELFRLTVGEVIALIIHTYAYENEFLLNYVRVK